MERDNLTLGSLFDGSGGFPLGGMLAGITPVFAAEVEPFPIRVTTKRMPFVKHYGDVNSIHGNKIEPVDIITYGSPCQNLSIAGKRTGLAGEQSSLFFQAIRIIKEMRCATDGKYPRWIVWENVPGAFSSNKGEDFRAVLEAVCSIKDGTVPVPGPPKGKWETARTLDGNGGNPSCNQGGIAVVAVQGSMIGREDRNGPQGSGVNEDVSFTLNATDHHAVAYPTYCTSKNSHFTRAEEELANTLVATDYKDPPVINDLQTASGRDVFGTLSASMGSKQWLGNQEAFSGDYHIMEPDYIVRRLTPTECARCNAAFYSRRKKHFIFESINTITALSFR